MAEIVQKLGFDASKAISTLDSLTDSLNRANTALAGFNTSAAGRAAAGLDKTTKSLDKAKKKSESFLISWQTMARILGTQLVVRGLNVIIQGLQSSVNAAQELGLAIEEIRTIDSESRGALELSKGLLDLSDALGKAPVDLAEGLYQTLSNQVVKAGDALNFTSEAAKLATITASETGDAVNALSSIMNSYQLEASEANRVSGGLFATVEQGRLRLGEIANVIGRVTPLTAQMGIAWEEVAASIATMTRQGVRADTAITQLRAVITRLLKPTDDVRALFHKWGVVDAKQAVASFGGLTGVLKKLSEETGGSSQEFSELLKNVRAISGAMGIMVDDGKLMAEVLGEVEQGAEKANAAFSEFAESEAFRFQKAVTQLSNDLTRMGQTLLPLVLKVTEGLAGRISGLAMGIRVITGEFDKAGIQAEIHNRLVADGVKRVEELRQKREESIKDVYTPLRTSMNEYYIEANKKEFELQNIRNQATTTAGDVMIAAIKAVDGVYDDAFRSIEDFNKRIGVEIENNLKGIEGVGSKLSDAYTSVQLKRAKTDADRLKIFDDASGKAAREQAVTSDRISADPKTLKVALAANDKLVGLRLKQFDLAIKMEKPEREINRLQGLYLKAVASETGLRLKANKAMEAGQKELERQAQSMDEIKARLKAISAEEEAIAKAGEATEQQQRRLNELQAERVELNDKAVANAAKLADVGLELEFETVVRGLTDALNQSKKDWPAEVKRAQDVFAASTLSIKVKLDPEGALSALGKDLNIEKLPAETLATFFARIEQAAADAGETQIRTYAAIRDNIRLQIPLLKNLESNIKNVGTAATLSEESLSKTMGIGDATTLAQWFDDPEITQAQIKLTLGFREANKALQAGKSISEDQLTTIKETIDSEVTAGTLFNSRAADMKAVLKTMEDINRLILEGDEVEATLLPEDTITRIEQANLKSKETLEAAKETGEKASEAKGQLDQTKQSAEQAASSTGGITEKLGEATVKAGELNTQVAHTQVVAQSPYGAIDGITSRLVAATAAANALNMALAASGGGAVPANQGGRFFADGGMARGQDRIAASLAPGETVTNAKDSRRFFSELNAMNQGNQPVFREQGGPVTTVGDVNVTVKGGDSSQQTVREIGHALRREIQRGNIKLR